MNEVISHPTAKVRAVKVMAEPYVGVQTATMLCVPLTVPSAGVIVIAVYRDEPPVTLVSESPLTGQVIQDGLEAVAPLNVHWMEVICPSALQLGGETPV